MLGVDGVVLHGGVEPQAVALLAVVERALERARRRCGGACGRRGVRRARLAGFSSSSSASASAALAAASSALRASSSACAGLLLGAALGLLLELGGDRGVVLGAEVDLLGGGAGSLAVGLQILLALERLDLLDGDVELVRDPGVGATLSHPPADLVKLRTQGPATHERPVD